MRRTDLAVLIVILLVPRAAAAQGDPLGPEFRVNTFTTGDQAYPSIAAASSSGNFVVVWNGGAAQDGYIYGVFGQRYASSGDPLGPEFRVNTYVTGSQSRPSVAADTSGNFVVVWRSLGQDGYIYGVFGQRFAASGAPLGPEFRVNTYTTSYQRDPAVASDSAGNFVVVWENYIGGYFGYDIAAQQRLLTEAASLVDRGVLRTTVTSAVNDFTAAGIRRAHGQVESGRMIGKVVVHR